MKDGRGAEELKARAKEGGEQDKGRKEGRERGEKGGRERKGRTLTLALSCAS